jgi:hypothetical protein
MIDLQKSHAVLTDLPMRPVNMPYYHGPRIWPQPPPDNTSKTLHIQSLLTDIVTSSGNENTYLVNIPVRFGHVLSNNSSSKANTRELMNSEFASYAFQAVYFTWAVYSFSIGHFSFTIQLHHLPFHIILMCNASELG